MKSFGIVVGIILAAVIAIGGFVIMNYASAVRTGVDSEAAIEAAWQNNRNVLGNYTTKIAEMAQIPDIQRDNLERVLETSLSARYGDDGSQAVFQFIQENYAGQLDNTLYQNIQNEMAAGRADFTNKQTILLEKLAVYERQRGYMWSGFWLKLAGFPKKDLSKFNIVTSSHADRAFDTGIDNGVQLRRTEPEAEAPAPAQ